MSRIQYFPPRPEHLRPRTGNYAPAWRESGWRDLTSTHIRRPVLR